MASGAPDWHKISDVDIQAQSIGDVNINVAGQSISEIINRPTYGEGEEAIATEIVSAGTTESIITISGTGVLYGGWVTISDTNNHFNDKPKIYIDGNYFAGVSFNSLFNNGFIKNSKYLFNLTRKEFDSPHYRAVACIGSGVTFETSLQLQYQNSEATDIDVGAILTYATI